MVYNHQQFIKCITHVVYNSITGNEQIIIILFSIVLGVYYEFIQVKVLNIFYTFIFSNNYITYDMYLSFCSVNIWFDFFFMISIYIVIFSILLCRRFSYFFLLKFLYVFKSISKILIPRLYCIINNCKLSEEKSVFHCVIKTL